jgi:hypothetical protein
MSQTLETLAWYKGTSGKESRVPTVPRLRAPREPEIRAALKGWLQTALGGEAAIIDELAIKHGKYRVDVCALTDRLHGYEIKSDQDTLKRLPAQAKHFSLVFHRMTLVIGPGLLASALAIVPPWWGLMLVTQDETGEARFSILREPEENPKPNYRWVVRLLWRDELTACLKARGVRGYSKLKYWEVANAMLATFTPDELTAHVTQVLRERKGEPVEPFEAHDMHDEDGWIATDNSYWDDHWVG